MFIAYDIKNGIEYAKAVVSKRNGSKIDKTYINLGRVIDKEKLIFKNRKQGVFTFDPNSGECSSPDSEIMLPPDGKQSKEKYILDFGDSFFLDSFIKQDGLKEALDYIYYPNPDTLYAMVHYYILCSMSNRHAGDWFEGNYARILYPKANLVSQRISEFLAAIGEEENLRNFFNRYIEYVTDKADDCESILIDSTGLPNSIHFPLTAISNHNGNVSNEVRLIYVTHQTTGLPIYFRYVAGNIIDVSTLKITISELKAANVNTKFAVLDAGYYTEQNIQELYNANISFVTRLKPNFNVYKNLVAEHLSTIEQADNLIEYNGRYIYVKCIPVELVQGHTAYAYLCLDIERKAAETQKLFKRAKAEKLDVTEVYNRMAAQGAFVIVSSRKVTRESILPTYYTRQQIEQVFDIGKNYADMLPLRIRTEETFRGHLLLTFIASVILKRLQDTLKSSVYNPISMFLNLRNQKCKVYDSLVIAQEANKKANDCYKLFGIKCPAEIPIKRG